MFQLDSTQEYDHLYSYILCLTKSISLKPYLNGIKVYSYL